MDLRKIEYFVKVAEKLNISQAAKEIPISHQALSQQIRLLEKELGGELFSRGAKNISLTPAGQRLYDIFYPILQDCYRGYTQVESLIQQKEPEIKIGYFNAFSYGRIVSPLIQQLLEKKQNLKVSMLASDIDKLPTLLAQGEIDLAVTLYSDRIRNSEYVCRAYMDTELKILVSQKHPWYQKQYVTKEDVEAATLLVYRNRPMTGENAFLPQVQVTKRIAVANVDTYMAMLELGETFGIVGEAYNHREGTLKLLELPIEYRTTEKIMLIFKDNRELGELLER